MDAFGLRELRQHASELVRRAEAGEHLLITVAGRPAAVLGPPERDHWRRYEDIADVLAGPDDTEWEADRHLLDDPLVEPWQAGAQARGSVWEESVRRRRIGSQLRLPRGAIHRCGWPVVAAMCSKSPS